MRQQDRFKTRELGFGRIDRRDDRKQRRKERLREMPRGSKRRMRQRAKQRRRSWKRFDRSSYSEEDPTRFGSRNAMLGLYSLEAMEKEQRRCVA